MILSNELALLLGDTSRCQFFLLFCVFCFSVSISLMVGAHSVLQHDFSMDFMRERKAGADRALKILSKDSETEGTRSPEQTPAMHEGFPS